MKRLLSIASLFIILAFHQISTASDPPRSGLVLALPDVTWALEITEPGYVLEEAEIASDGDAARLHAANKATGVILSAFVEKSPIKGSPKECRDFYWTRMQQSPFKMEQIKLYETGSMALVEYIIPDYLGKQVNQKNVNAYLVEGDYWIDVHLSKSSYQAGTSDPMASTLKSVRINRSYTPTVLDRIAFGDMFFRQKDYGKAALHYEKALDLEQKNPTLHRTRWIILVDQLGMSYGISGELANSERLYKWAITKEPEYPMFYYNLACAFAEMGKPDEALRNLRMANKFKNNMIPGETLPDPRTDSSFRECLNDKQFKAELDTMKW